MELDYVNPRLMTGGRGDAPIAGHQRRVQNLSERHIERIVGG